MESENIEAEEIETEAQVEGEEEVEEQEDEVEQEEQDEEEAEESQRSGSGPITLGAVKAARPPQTAPGPAIAVPWPTPSTRRCAINAAPMTALTQ